MTREFPPSAKDGTENKFQLSTETVGDNKGRRLFLPSLVADLRANSMAILGCQAKKVSEVWTRAEWTNFCKHLHNDNDLTHFVMGFRSDDQQRHYVRSKRVRVDRAISWSWQSIAGSPKSKLAFVPYASNERQQSRWGGMDFDAHLVGQADRARELAFGAFRCFLNAPNLCVILETSGGGGWHVWAISPDFHDTREWVRLLKSVAAHIGAPILPGVCEIFPPDSLPSRYGRGMRAPGCWNPGTDSCSEIVWQNAHTSLEAVLSRKSKTDLLNCKDLEVHFPDKRNKLLSLPPLSSTASLYRETNFLQKFGITLPKTRNLKLSRLVGEVFNQVGHTAARGLAEAQFRGKTVATTASEAEHMDSFSKLWTGLFDKWTASLTKPEHVIFTRLETDNERDAFRIIRSFAIKAKQDGAADFPVARDNLAERLGITGNGAGGIREKFVRLGIITKTADYVPNKFAARFKWLLSGPDRQLEV